MKINENQKVTLTIGQLKRLVKEARYSDRLKNLDDPAYSDSPNEYAVRKLRDQMSIDLTNLIASRGDLEEANEVLSKIMSIIHNRFEDDATSNNFNNAIKVLGSAGFNDIIVSEDGDEVGKFGFGYEGMDHVNGPYMIQVTDNIQVIFLPYQNTFTFSMYSDSPVYTYSDFIDQIMSKKICYCTDDDQPTRDISDDEVKKIAAAIHTLRGKIPYVFDKVDKIYDAFTTIKGVKLTEGRFADKLERLNSLNVDEGRFEDKLAELERFT